MRCPKLAWPVALAVLVSLAALPAAPAAAQHGHIEAPSQSPEPVSPPPPEPPPPPPSPPPEPAAPPASDPAPPPSPPEPEPAPAPPSAGAEAQPSDPGDQGRRIASPPAAIADPQPTDPGTVGRRIADSPPPAYPPPTDPGTVGRRIPASEGNDGGGDQPFCPPYLSDGTFLSDMQLFGMAPAPASMATLARAIDVEMVEVEVFVSDSSGQPVRGLAKDDFLLFVDGAALPIASFYAQTASAGGTGVDQALIERLIGLQTFYSLGFVPARPAGGRERRIVVLVKGRGGLTVRLHERQPDGGGS